MGFSEKLFIILWKRKILVTGDETSVAQNSLEIRHQNLNEESPVFNAGTGVNVKM